MAKRKRKKKMTKDVEIAPSLNAKMKAQDRQWERESDLRTLRDAAKIRKDPKRLAGAKAEAKAQMKDLQSVTD